MRNGRNGRQELWLEDGHGGWERGSKGEEMQKWGNGRKELRVKDMIRAWEIRIGGLRQ